MDKYEELANEIIDEVSELIENYYKIEPVCMNDDDNIENPALINGEVYYSLEESIAKKIRNINKQIME